MYRHESEETKELSEALHKLYNPKLGKYKRVCVAPLRYPGGKSLAVGHILEHLPVIRNKKMVSLFLGGGSVEVFMASLGYQVVAYDVFDILCNFWQILCEPASREQMVNILSTFRIDREEFTLNREILFHYWNKNKPPP